MRSHEAHFLAFTVRKISQGLKSTFRIWKSVVIGLRKLRLVCADARGGGTHDGSLRVSRYPSLMYWWNRFQLHRYCWTKGAFWKFFFVSHCIIGRRKNSLSVVFSNLRLKAVQSTTYPPLLKSSGCKDVWKKNIFSSFIGTRICSSTQWLE